MGAQGLMPRSTVYPRPRGGTSARRPYAPFAAGLSPPTRGNPGLRRRHAGAAGSIPAHAGEPDIRTERRRMRTVYPRPRGGTPDAWAFVIRPSGLSPPTRGNQRRVGQYQHHLGSIPAHAGEPKAFSIADCPLWVYPRPRGGTNQGVDNAAIDEGLSPPTRGNHWLGGGELQPPGSIPAHAGEPFDLSINPRLARVYPRPRGGTAMTGGVPANARGLSPPTRGNLGGALLGILPARSIPAHAGEPSR